MNDAREAARASFTAALARILHERYPDAGHITVEIVEPDRPGNVAPHPRGRKVQGGPVTTEHDTNTLGERKRAA